MHVSLFNQTQNVLKNLQSADFEPIYQLYFPESCVHYCYDFFSTQQIKFQLSNKKQNVIIVDEEDTYLKLDFKKFCVELFQYDKNLLLLTNSSQAKEIACTVGLNAKHTFSLTDAICYHSIDNMPMETTQIKFYSGVVYHDMNHSFRKEAMQFLYNNFEHKLVVFSDENKTHNPMRLNFKGRIRHPMMNFQKDYVYAKHMAFGIALENYDKCEFGPTVTEKIYKYVHLKRPVIAYGASGIRDYLAQWGFDTWDWLIDWDFDQEHDNGKRQEKFKKELTRLFAIPLGELKQILDMHRDKLEYNATHIQALINDYPNIIGMTK